MDITINRPRDGLHASHEAIVRATQEAEQLDDTSERVLERLQRLTHAVPIPGGLPVELIPHLLNASSRRRCCL
jgi:hypothetical protein